MTGSYRIVIQNAAIRYDFEIRRNITIIKGDSATGKTTLIEMIREYYENGESSGIELNCEKTCSVLSGRDWKVLLSVMKEQIIFIDEGNNFVLSDEFARLAQESGNYFVIVTREGLANLPYSVEEIYGIRESGKYAGLKQTYQELYHLYGEKTYTGITRPEKVIVEDSNAGFQFYEKLSENQNWTAVSANGKSNVFDIALECGKERKILVIADGAAFGPEMDRMMKLMKHRSNIVLYLPESFEWLILSSGILKDSETDKILDVPSEYIDSKKYFSWERFFTDLLIEKTKGTYLVYTKRKLNRAYLSVAAVNKILSKMDRIELRTES